MRRLSVPSSTIVRRFLTNSQQTKQFFASRFYSNCRIVNSNRCAFLHNSFILSKEISIKHNRFYSTNINDQSSSHSADISNENTGNKAAEQNDDKPQDSNQNTTQKKDLKIEILDRSLKYVEAFGWSTDSLSYAANEIGLSDQAHGMFPEGGFAIVEHVMNKAKEEMTEYITNHEEIEFLPSREVLFEAIKKRLEAIAPYVQSGKWQEAMAIAAFPANVPASLQHLYALANELCFLSNQHDVDFNWYAKRAAVAGIYTATELYMLTDKSEGFQDTWNFLRNRINDALFARDLLCGIFDMIKFR